MIAPGGAPELDIVAKDLSHSYGPLSVLQGIDFHVRAGEIVAVLGPSGCGKSTLLRLIGGLEIPTSGVVGTASSDGTRAGWTVSFAFQDPTLLPWRTVAGNVALPLERFGLPRDERDRRVADVLARVQLTQFAASYPRDLSGGMRQRTGIARALVVDPDLLLLDEPFSALDALTRDVLIADLVRRWGDRRYTCICVTHSPGDAARLSSRVIVLSPRPGRIRGIVTVDVAMTGRSEDDPGVVAARSAIWSLIRGAAAANGTTPC
jgi:NitT/TauT family transport system ATP-binding protein